jgi:hypothetical protein
LPELVNQQKQSKNRNRHYHWQRGLYHFLPLSESVAKVYTGSMASAVAFLAAVGHLMPSDWFMRHEFLQALAELTYEKWNSLRT